MTRNKRYQLLVLDASILGDTDKAEHILDMLAEEKAFPITAKQNPNVPEGVVLVCQPPTEEDVDGFTIGRWESHGIPIMGYFAVDNLNEKSFQEQLRGVIQKNRSNTADSSRTKGTGEARV